MLAIVRDKNQKAQVEDARKSNEERSNPFIDLSLESITIALCLPTQFLEIKNLD